MERLEGDYHIESRRLGARNQDPQKYARDRDLLLAEVARDPDDARSVFYLAQSYFDLGDFANAQTWYERRAEMGGWDEEVFRSMFRVAESMSNLGDAVARHPGRLPSGLGVPARPGGTVARHRLPIPPR